MYNENHGFFRCPRRHHHPSNCVPVIRAFDVYSQSVNTAAHTHAIFAGENGQIKLCGASSYFSAFPVM
jgi:hypothetical protein